MDELRTEPVRIGVVSFVNTLPLIDGLENLADVSLRCTVPSLLIDLLLNDEVDVALCSSIDYQMASEPLVVLPVGMLGCAGPTLTVRLYSMRPIHEIERVFCDTDSHTSVILLQVLLRELHGRSIELVEYDAREHVAGNRPVDLPEAMLLIGDKVVTDSPLAIRYPYQLDLGAAWFDHTGLPFVFATWMARATTSPAILNAAGAVLDRQRRQNALQLDDIIARRARPHDWPLDLAEAYLKDRLRFDLDEASLEGLSTFYTLAHTHGLLTDVRPLAMWRDAAAPSQCRV